MQDALLAAHMPVTLGSKDAGPADIFTITKDSGGSAWPLLRLSAAHSEAAPGYDRLHSAGQCLDA